MIFILLIVLNKMQKNDVKETKIIYTERKIAFEEPFLNELTFDEDFYAVSFLSYYHSYLNQKPTDYINN